MKKIIFSVCFATLFQIIVFGCSFSWIPFCDHMDAYDNILAGVITAKSDNGISIEVLEVFKGSENSTSITVWDGIAGDCNGTPETSDTRNYGNLGDTIIFALGMPITKVTYDWDVVGDYRKPVNFYDYPDVWNPEFFKVENNQVVIEQAYADEPLIYSYDELTAQLSSGDCISKVAEHGNCDEILENPWLAELIENADGCEVGSIQQFSYNGSDYINVNPYTQFSYFTCPSDLPTKVYNCTGDLVCTIGGYGFQLKHTMNKSFFDECDANLTNAALNASLLWTYSNPCENPLELEIVQNAISNFCTEAVYSFDYNNQSYVYIIDHVRCDGIEQYGQLYNCSIGAICTLDSCEPVLNQLQNQLNEENLIWAKVIDPFEKYPWLSDLINPEYCTVKVTEYKYSEYYTFVMLDNSNETGRLYFQDGTLYCNGATDYCLSLYNLTEPGTLFFDCTTGSEHLEVEVSNLTCTNNGKFTFEVTVTDDVGTPTNGRYGIRYPYGEEGTPRYIYFSEGETITYEGNISNAENGLYTIYVHDRGWADDAAQRIEIEVTECLSEETLFNQYNWLYTIVDPNNCNGVKITEHFYGTYAFLYVEDNNKGTLYFQDGTFYCADNLDNYCLDLYSFDIPATTWQCSNENEEGCRIDDPISLPWIQDIINTDEENYLDAIILFEYEGSSYFRITSGSNVIDGISIATYSCDGILLCVSSVWFEEIYVEGSEEVCQASASNGETIWTKSSSNVLFDTYPWLNTLVDENNCQDASIEVYAYGAYDFIFIQDHEGKKLFFQDGTFYCADSPTYSCIEAYELNTPKNEWTCGGVNQKRSILSSEPNIDFKVDFKVFPNPSKGHFTVEFADMNNDPHLIKTMNMDGKLIQSIHVEAFQQQVTVNLDGISKGMYLLQLHNNDHTITQSQRIIIH